MDSVNYKMLMHFKLTDAVVNMRKKMNGADIHNRWTPDEDWVQSFKFQPVFLKVTPGQLNRVIAITVDFMNKKYEDPKGGRTIFHNTSKVITREQRRKQKRKIYVYYVSSDD
jgi:hypothetical protein